MRKKNKILMKVKNKLCSKIEKSILTFKCKDFLFVGFLETIRRALVVLKSFNCAQILWKVRFSTHHFFLFFYFSQLHDFLSFLNIDLLFLLLFIFNRQIFDLLIHVIISEPEDLVVSLDLVFYGVIHRSFVNFFPRFFSLLRHLFFFLSLSLVLSCAFVEKCLVHLHE